MPSRHQISLRGLPLAVDDDRLEKLTPQKVQLGGNPDQALDLELRQKHKAVTDLSDELEVLFAEMGKHTAVIRAGQKHAFRIAAGMMRTVEVRLPQVEKSAEWQVEVECSLNPEKHKTSPSEDNDEAELLPPEPFEVCIADTSRHASDGGPYRYEIGMAKEHFVNFGTDFSSFFVNLTAPQTCFVVLKTRTWEAGQGQAMRTKKHSDEDSDEDDTEKLNTDIAAGFKSKAGRKLHTKLKNRRQTMAAEEDHSRKDRSTRHVSMSISHHESSSTSLEMISRGNRTFGQYVFPDGIPESDDLAQIQLAQERVLKLWLFPISRFINPGLKKPKGAWMRAISHDFPRKLIRHFRQVQQDRSAMTSIAIGGAFAFFLKRQRQLHLMRCRTALRQLAWYKVLFAASRFRFLVVFAAKGREQSRGPSHAIRSARGVSTITALKPNESIVNMVRRCNRSFGPRRAGRAVPAALQGEDGTENQLQVLEGERRIWSELAKQGFWVHPKAGRKLRANWTKAGSRHGASREEDLPLLAGHQAAARELSERLGHPLAHGTKPVLHLEDAGSPEARLAREVSNATTIVTLRPDELATALSSSNASVSLMGVDNFTSFYKHAVQKTASELLKRRAEVPETTQDNGVVKIKIIKRYLLRFFDEEQPDLPWLSLLESLMLVIRGKAVFQSSSERETYETKLPKFNEERKAALRKPGLFTPIEACLWSHPVILGQTSRLQRDMVRGDSATAWKGVVFEGRGVLSSGRDVLGDSLRSMQVDGGSESALLRKAIDMAGPFDATGMIRADVETPNKHDFYVATRTASGFKVRPFGYQDSTLKSSFRVEDHSNDMANDVVPKELRLDRLWRRRRDRDAHVSSSHLGERTAAMIADGESWGLEKYKSWVMRTDIPRQAREQKEKYFDGMTSMTSNATSNPQSPLGSVRLVGSKSPRKAKSAEEQSGDVDESLLVEEASRDSASTQQKTSKLGNASYAAPTAPQTAEEVGMWLANNDALKTIRGDSESERTTAGWVSGFRKTPMTEEELVKTRILERQEATRVRRGRSVPHSAR